MRAIVEIARFIVKTQTVMKAETVRAEMTFLSTGGKITLPESVGIAGAIITQAIILASLVRKLGFSNPPVNPVAGKIIHNKPGLRRAKDRVEALQVRCLTVAEIEAVVEVVVLEVAGDSI